MIHTSSSRFRTVAAAVLAVSSISLLGACAGVRSTNTSGVSNSGVRPLHNLPQRVTCHRSR